MRRNASGYSDPTAYQAIKNMEDEDVKFHELLNTIFYVCRVAGFKIDGRITLINEETGRVWR